MHLDRKGGIEKARQLEISCLLYDERYAMSGITPSIHSSLELSPKDMRITSVMSDTESIVALSLSKSGS